MDKIRTQIDKELNELELRFSADDIKSKYKKQRNKKITAVTTGICSFVLAFVILLIPIMPENNSIFKMIMSKNFLSGENNAQGAKTYTSCTSKTAQTSTAKKHKKNKKHKNHKRHKQEPTENQNKTITAPTKHEPVKKPSPATKKTETTKPKATKPASKLTKKELFIGQYQYSVHSDGTAEITGFEGVSMTLKIPSEIDGYKVTKIGNSAFSRATNAYRVIIPEGVTDIEDFAFDGAYSIESVILPNSLESIGAYAFRTCPIKSITIPDNVKSIGYFAFGAFKTLTNVKLGKGIEKLGVNAFYKTDELVISGYIDTIAFNYAKKNDIKFINLGYAH